MNRNNVNNFRIPAGRGFGNYVPNNNDRNYPQIPMFPRLDGSRGAYDPWRPTEETIISGPLGLMGLSLRPPSNMEIIVLGNRTQASTSTQEESSRLTQDVQMNALKKLRKEIYDPVPKRISRRLCLYYRDQAANIVKEMAKEKEEEGKRCAVCLEDFEAKEMVMVTPCNHMFHEDCIVPWVKSHAQCPVCRFSICEPTPRSSTSINNFPNSLPDSDLLVGTDLLSILRAMGAM